MFSSLSSLDRIPLYIPLPFAVSQPQHSPHLFLLLFRLAFTAGLSSLSGTLLSLGGKGCRCGCPLASYRLSLLSGPRVLPSTSTLRSQRSFLALFFCVHSPRWAMHLTVSLFVARGFPEVKPFGPPTSLLYPNYIRNLTIRSYIWHKASAHSVLVTAVK